MRLQQDARALPALHATCMSTLVARRPPTVAHTSGNNYGWGPKVNCPVFLVELIGEVKMERSDYLENHSTHFWQADLN